MRALGRHRRAQPGCWFWTSSALSLLLLTACGGEAGPDVEVFEFRDGAVPSATYFGAMDAFILENEPTRNFGRALVLEVDGDTPGTTTLDGWTLMAFDLSAIPQGKRVDSVELVIQLVKPSREKADLFAITRPWEEDEVNWTDASKNHPWGAPGANGPGDRGDAVLAHFIGVAPGQQTITFNPAGVAQAQVWLDEPLENHGFIVVQPLATDGVDFVSSEGAVEHRPLLRVSVTDPVKPEDESAYAFGCTQSRSGSGGAWLLVSGVAAGLLVRRRRYSLARSPSPHST